MRPKITESDLSYPVAALGLVALVIAAVACLSLVGEFDLQARQHDEALAANGLRGRLTEIGNLSTGVTVWDDAVRNLDNQFDLAWTRQNIGVFFWQTDHFEHSFVLDPDDQVRFAALEGRPAELASYKAFSAGAAPLIAAVRAAEAKRGVTRAPAVSATPSAIEPIFSCGFGRNDATPETAFVLCAALVSSEFGGVKLQGRTAPIVVNSLPLKDDFIAAFAARFLLHDLTLLPADRAIPAGAAHVDLTNARGDKVAALCWSPLRPGLAMLRRVGLPLLGMLGGLAAGMGLLYRRARRTARELVTSEARAIHLAYHDALTGLPNRALFHDRLSHALGRIRRGREALAVFCLDLDRFKLINDTFGHPAGDELIQKAGRIMVSLCRPSETVARMSGDEFAIIMPDASVSAAAALAERLTQALRAPIDLDIGQVFIGCSAGITLVTDSSLQPAEILRQADMALYRSKETLKGSFSFFEPDMDRTIKMRRALESDLRAALATGGLYLVYQPQVNDRAGLFGVEALLRWQHPERGQMNPASFVAIAEECGLIVDLGRFAMRRAFEDSKRWPGLKVAINISPKQLRMKDFADTTIALAEEVGVDPHMFELEITESLLLGDDPQTHSILRQLREHGFDLALDDFGTGYSSLSYLQRYPINRIKIDRSFIANLGEAREAEEFITAIVRLARALRLSVIAEGVETRAQESYLAAAGCSDMQGYLHGRPMPAADIDAIFASRVSLVAHTMGQLQD